MRNIPPGLAAALSGPLTRLAICWRIQRADGVLVALTSHDRDIEIDGIRYQASSGLDLSAMAESAGSEIDNLEVRGALAARNIRAEDIRAGRFDGARVRILLADWSDPAAGTIVLKEGVIGRIRSGELAFEAELRGPADRLEAPITERLTPFCRAELGDARCKRGLRAFTREVRVTALIDPVTIEVTPLDDPDGWYDFGRLRWHLGANTGALGEIRRQVGGRLSLFAPPAQPVSVGDLAEIVAGCDKARTTCRDKFDNLANFRGEPFLPGIDRLLDYPGQPG
ncbi:MAG: DUF2163 domain-containing protein [Alphaproteobacteria bacterium]|nr:MAG: DUF2163 domain-containing protein [Alphaproteobacteria bacterium]